MNQVRAAKKRNAGSSGRSLKSAVLFSKLLAGVLLLVAARMGLAAADDSSRTNGPAPLEKRDPQTTPGQPADSPTMEVAQAVMVTVELDFGPKIPSIADALREIHWTVER